MSRLIAKAPEIGFDRFIQLDWVAAALSVQAGKINLEELSVKLSSAGLGKEAQIKTQTKLNALVLEPRPHLLDFIHRGVRMFAGASTLADVAPFGWGAAIAVYPYFGRVAELTGRLTSIQGDCSVAEVHRRVSELYGDREVTKRATQAVLQTQANWGAIERIAHGKRLVRLPRRPTGSEDVVLWLLEAAIRYHGKAMPLATIQSMSVIYPFLLEGSPAYITSSSSNLELRSEGANQQFLALRETI